GSRYSVNPQEQLAGSPLPATDVPEQAEPRPLLAVIAAGDDDVLVDRRRRRKAEATVHVAAHARREIDRAIFSETGCGLPALGIDSDQPIARSGEQPRRRVPVSGPVSDAAPADRSGRRVFPDDRRRFRLE